MSPATYDPDFNVLKAAPPRPILDGIRDGSIQRERAAIDDESSTLQNELGLLGGLLEDLAERVLPVSSSPTPIDEGGPDREFAGESGIYGRLHNSVDAVYFLQNRVRNIKNRLEV